MRVALVSTHPPQRCGIGTYTAALAPSLADLRAEVTVVAERGALPTSGSAVRVLPCFDRAGDFSVPVLRAVVAEGAQVLHLQHSPDIFGTDERVLRLAAEAHRRGVAAFVTLHTVHTAASAALERRSGVGRFHRNLSRYATLVVHGAHAKAGILVPQGVAPDRVVVIDHGTTLVERPARDEARRALALPSDFLDAKLLLYFGFIHPQKNLHTIVVAMRRLRSLVPAARLLVVGSIQNPSPSNRAYLWACRRAVSALGLEAHVAFQERFVDPSEVALLHGAADLVVLPYAQRYGSASGIVHGALGAGSLVLCSDSPKFAEVGERIDPRLQVATHSPRAWAERAAELLTRPDERARLAGRVRELARETAWPRVAERHLATYGA